jgi:hypothetical protein
MAVRRYSLHLLTERWSSSKRAYSCGAVAAFHRLPVHPRYLRYGRCEQTTRARSDKCCPRVYNAQGSQTGALFRHPASCSALASCSARGLVRAVSTPPVWSVLAVSISAVRIPPLPQDYVTCLCAQHGSLPARLRPRHLRIEGQAPYTTRNISSSWSCLCQVNSLFTLATLMYWSFTRPTTRGDHWSFNPYNSRRRLIASI